MMEDGLAPLLPAPLSMRFSLAAASGTSVVTRTEFLDAREGAMPGGYALGETLYYIGSSTALGTANTLCTASRAW